MEKNNKVLIIALLLLVIILGGYIAYDKLLSNNNKEEVKTPDNNVMINYRTISDVAGKYTVKYDNLKDTGDVKSATVTLSLYEDGIFTYVYSQYAPYGTIGSYYVENDKIILKNWFNSGSGTGLSVTKGTKTLTISDDGKISDNNINVKPLIDSEITVITLAKDGELTQFDLSNRLGTAFFTESNHTISEPAM